MLLSSLGMAYGKMSIKILGTSHEFAVARFSITASPLRWMSVLIVTLNSCMRPPSPPPHTTFWADSYVDMYKRLLGDEV